MKGKTIKQKLFALIGALFICIYAEKPSAQWTIMMYLNGNNDLEEYIIENIRDLVKSNRQLRIVIFFRSKSKTQQYLKGLFPKKLKKNVQICNEKTLSNFINWAIKEHQAQRYMLIIASHGNGSAILDNYTKRPQSLYHYEIKNAIRTALNKHGIKKLDIIGFNSCFMATMETARQMQEVAEFMIASEYRIPLRGWPYNIWLKELKELPTMEANILAEKIVDYYNKGFEQKENYTLSAIQLSSLPSLINSFNKLLHKSPFSISQIHKIRNNCFAYHYKIPLIDLGNFLNQFAQNGTSNFEKKAHQIYNIITNQQNFNRIIWKNNPGKLNEKNYGSTGLSIYFPKSIQEHYRDFFEYELTINYYWHNFLKKIWSQNYTKQTLQSVWYQTNTNKIGMLIDSNIFVCTMKFYTSKTSFTEKHPTFLIEPAKEPLFLEAISKKKMIKLKITSATGMRIKNATVFCIPARFWIDSIMVRAKRYVQATGINKPKRLKDKKGNKPYPVYYDCTSFEQAMKNHDSSYREKKFLQQLSKFRCKFDTSSSNYLYKTTTTPTSYFIYVNSIKHQKAIWRWRNR